LSRRPKAPKSPSVDLRQVQRLADLSRLSLAPQEAERLRAELSSILGYFAVLDNAKLTKGLPLQEPVTEGAPREDVVRPSNPDEILAGVPQKKGRYVRAPRVF
jgi:aspartyl/glutamyl-tRNA(Asn/Gln) amidotransferase C subunit